MKLKDAYLCIDCDEIFQIDGSPGACCPKCASRAFAPIAGWITTWTLADRLHELNTGRKPVPAAVDLAVDLGRAPAVVREYEYESFVKVG